MTNQQIILKKRPIGTPAKECFELNEIEIPTIQDKEVLVKVHYISIDPAMRGWMNDAKSYIKPVALGDVMRALGAGEVMESKDENFKKGEFVSGSFGVQNYAVIEGKDLVKIDPSFVDLPVYLGTLGMSGLTGYFGLINTGEPKEGETVLVSGAAGAVGSVVGQIAKIKGCRAVGIAGSDEKCDYVVSELGFDACINYKKENLRRNIKEACPEGVDVYFDNVGGEILDTALTLINKKARIVICGAISQYNATELKGPKNYLSLLVNRAKMEGIVIFDNAPHYKDAAMEMGKWIAEGKLNAEYHVETGGPNAFYDTFINLFKGINKGKLVLKMI